MENKENKIFLDNTDLIITNAVEDKNFLKIDGTAAHFGSPNLNGEIVDANSFSDFFDMYNGGKLNPALNYNHDSNMLIGGVDRVYIQDNTLCCSAHLNKNIAFCRDTLIPMIMSGDVKSYSTEGYVNYNDIVMRDDGTYYASNFLLTAVAIVSTPADYRSEFTIKNCFERIEREKMESAVRKRWYLMF